MVGGNEFQTLEVLERILEHTTDITNLSGVRKIALEAREIPIKRIESASQGRLKWEGGNRREGLCDDDAQVRVILVSPEARRSGPSAISLSYDTRTQRQQ